MSSIIEHLKHLPNGDPYARAVYDAQDTLFLAREILVATIGKEAVEEMIRTDPAKACEQIARAADLVLRCYVTRAKPED